MSQKSKPSPKSSKTSLESAELLPVLAHLTRAVEALSDQIETLNRALTSQGLPRLAPDPSPRPASQVPSPAQLDGPDPGADSGQGGSGSGLGQEARELLNQLFAGAMAEDDDPAFDAFLTLVHSDWVKNRPARSRLRKSTWWSLRENLGSYLDDAGDASSYQVVRTVPEEPEAGDVDIKVFIEARGRRPVPVSMRRDPARDGALRLTDSSL